MTRHFVLFSEMDDNLLPGTGEVGSKSIEERREKHSMFKCRGHQ